MILNLNKYISCRCPVCTERSYIDVTPFQINGGYTEECSVCGAQFLGISKKQSGYSFKVSCFICETMHEFTVSLGNFMNKELLALGCPLTGIDLLYVGNKQNVYNAAAEADDIFSDFSETLTGDECLNDLPPFFEDAFRILNAKLTANNITCPCGHTKPALKISPNGITVMCDNCCAKHFIPIADLSDIRKFESMDVIELRWKTD